MTVTPAVAATVTGRSRRRRARDAVPTVVDGLATTVRAVPVRRKPNYTFAIMQKLERKRTRKRTNGHCLVTLASS